MRHAALALAALVALASPAAAESHWMSLQIEGLAEPLAPSGTPREVRLVAGVACDAVASGSSVAFSLASAPAWLVVDARPPPAPIDASPCPAGPAVATSVMTVRAAQSAPGMRDEGVQFKARVENGTRDERTENGTFASVGFAGILDVAVAGAHRATKPQSQANFPVTVVNLGNAPTRVVFELVSATEGFQVPLPNTITLEGRGEGARQTTGRVTIPVMAPFQNGPNSVVGLVTVAYRSHYALNDSLTGDSGEIPLRLTVEGFYMPAAGALPALGAALALQGLFAARKAARRRL